MGKEATGEELMVDDPKELALKKGVTSSITKEATPSGMGGVEEASVTQVPSIDTLLGDIYELKY